MLFFLFCSGRAAAVSYAYDASAPLDFRVGQTRTDNGVTVADVSYRSGDAIVDAAFVTPERPTQSMPAVLFVHWLGEAATTNRTEFLADAMWLARRGVVSLLPDQPWSQPGWFEKVRSTATDAADSRAEVISLRRSLDALLAAPGTDATRVAYVGHDFGAMYGALLAGVDSRPSSYVYMTPTVTFAEWFLLDKRRPPADPPHTPRNLGHSIFRLRSLERRMRRACCSSARTTSTYRTIKRARSPRPSAETKRYVRTDTGHDLNVTAAADDRRAWLAARFRLPRSTAG